MYGLTPETPMQMLTLFDSDKKALDYFIDYVCNTIESGMDDPLKVLAMTKKMEYITDRVNKRIKENQIIAAEKYGATKFQYMGTEMEYTGVYTKYDYTVCNDPLWTEASEIVKDREAFLKSLKEPMDIRVGDELVTVRPPQKKVTMGVKTTIK
jgi:hypothetical protein